MLLEQRILDLQKDKGALIDKVREFKNEVARLTNENKILKQGKTNVFTELNGGRRMTNLLTGHEDYITSHTRKEIMQKFNVNYNYVNNFCNRNGIRPIAERCRYFVTEEMKSFLKGHTIKETAYKFNVNYSWLSMKVREMNLPCKRQKSEVKLSAHSCKHTGEAHDMIKYLSKSFTNASIARVFGYSAERIRQICADNEEE